jgi:hypothetical protein
MAWCIKHPERVCVYVCVPSSDAWEVMACEVDRGLLHCMVAWKAICAVVLKRVQDKTAVHKAAPYSRVTLL